MARKFKTADYKKTLGLQTGQGDVLPPERLARFIVGVVAEPDLSRIYRQHLVVQRLNLKN